MNKEELHNIIEEQQPNICQIVAIKNNEIIYNDTWNNYKTTDNVHIASVTKSIISILIGIAIDKYGYLYFSNSFCANKVLPVCELLAIKITIPPSQRNYYLLN